MPDYHDISDSKKVTQTMRSKTGCILIYSTSACTGVGCDAPNTEFKHKMQTVQTLALLYVPNPSKYE